MKLKNVKFANSIKVGSEEPLFADERNYIIEAQKEPYLRVALKRLPTEWTYTTFYNVISFTPYAAEDVEPKSKKAKE